MPETPISTFKPVPDPVMDQVLPFLVLLASGAGAPGGALMAHGRPMPDRVALIIAPGILPTNVLSPDSLYPGVVFQVPESLRRDQVVATGDAIPLAARSGTIRVAGNWHDRPASVQPTRPMAVVALRLPLAEIPSPAKGPSRRARTSALRFSRWIMPLIVRFHASRI